MSANTSGESSGTSSSGDAGTSGEQSAPKTYTEDEFQKVFRANNWAQSRVKQLETELESAKGELASVQTSGEGSKKKSEWEIELKNRDTKIAELTAGIQQRDSKIRDYTVKQTVREAAKGKIRDDAFDAFWAVEGSNFDEVEFNGAKRIGLKTEPYEDLPNVIGTLAQKHAYFAANSRSAGTGTAEKGEVKTGGAMTVEQLKALPEAERIKVLSKDPALLQQYAMAAK